MHSHFPRLSIAHTMLLCTPMPSLFTPAPPPGTDPPTLPTPTLQLSFHNHPRSHM